LKYDVISILTLTPDALFILNSPDSDSVFSVATMATLINPTVSAAAMRLATPRRITSFGFSGAGFLACYHLGVAKCLMDQGILHKQGVLARGGDDDENKQNNTSSIALTGVSAGAIISAAVIAGVCPEQGMQAVMAVSRRTRDTGGYLDTLSPNCSLVDEMEEHLGRLIRESVYDDEEYFLQRIHNNKNTHAASGSPSGSGSLLRIGLTDRRVFPPVGDNPRAACYCDTFRSIDDVLAACILSSYVPGVTGPAWGSLDGRYSAVTRASKRLTEMVQLGHVKKANTGEPLTLSSPVPSSTANENNNDHGSSREICWDGGLVDAFPYIDKDTVIVTPLAVNVFPHASINPSITYDSSSNSNYSDENNYESSDNTKTETPCVRLNDRIQVHWTAANAHTFRCISFSSQDAVLQDKFAQGYDNAHQWLVRHSLISVHHHAAPQPTRTRLQNTPEAPQATAGP
jgi:predicted acylesterase/phospholipase RssA